MLNSKNMKEMRKKLLTNMEQEVEAGHQLYIRNFLLSWLLIVTGGQRPEALMKLKVQEVLEAEEAEDEDGEFTIPVSEHKTGTTYGIAHVPILNPVLLKLLHLYLIHVLQYEDMTEEERKSTPVFQTNNLRIEQLKKCIYFLNFYFFGLFCGFFKFHYLPSMRCHSSCKHECSFFSLSIIVLL